MATTSSGSSGSAVGLRGRLLLATLAAVLTSAPAASSPPPWQRTEQRVDCADFTTLRHIYFGDLHIHTARSADAYIFGTRVGPIEAYDFATGATITLSDDNELQTRSARIDRPLDFAAVTDHAEWLGEVRVCTTPASPVYDDAICEQLRQFETPEDRFIVTVNWLFPAGIPNPPPSLPLCEEPGIDCDAAAGSVWQEIQAAAEGAYDRTSDCSFTTFVGYEHTASPIGRHLHRNVIFRNENVPAAPASQLETHAGGIPQGVWSAIETDCLDAGNGCDALIIPHNSNLSEGQAWLDPADAAEAQRRQDMEPLAEIYQVKAASECRFDRLAGAGIMTEDELCTFEQRLESHEGPGAVLVPIEEYPARSMVRNTLKDGLGFEQTLGVNPFKMGFIAGTDTHNATGGNTQESDWEGAGGNNDSSPARSIGGAVRDNPGGLAVVWAEENSRDAIFAALRRRETYATSGTRPVLRLFAGRLRKVGCDATDFVDRAYADGVPMGGQLGSVRKARSPRFAVIAMKDPGTVEVPGTQLQRVQIIKGWVDALGQTHEKVFEVAGNPDNGATIDPATCASVGSGFDELCTVWEDPEFDRSQRAFYYARVLENPVCRWSTLVCKSVGVDPFAADCGDQATAAGEEFASCCLSEPGDPFFERVIQERAWSSPIWYGPDDISGLKGQVKFGSQPASDVLSLKIRMGTLPAQLDVAARDLTLTLRDDDEIYTVTILAGTFEEKKAGRSYVLTSKTGAPAGIKKAKLKVRSDGAAVLSLKTGSLDLATADRTRHFVELRLEIGTFRATHSRLWDVRGSSLRHAS